jgi:type II secretory pathway pseudopilin PulG
MQPEDRLKREKKKVLVLLIIGVLLVLAVPLALMYVSNTSTEVARDYAKVAAVRQFTTNAVSAAIICLDMKQTLSSPADNVLMCDDLGYTWPAIQSMGGRWQGCPFQHNADTGTFEFCATLPDRTIWKCTQSGCDTL